MKSTGILFLHLWALIASEWLHFQVGPFFMVVRWPLEVPSSNVSKCSCSARERVFPASSGKSQEALLLGWYVRQQRLVMLW